MSQKQEYGERLVSELKQHPQNPRRGNVEAIKQSIETSGFFGAIIVQKSTGYILAGNLRSRVAQSGRRRDGDQHRQRLRNLDR